MVPFDVSSPFPAGPVHTGGWWLPRGTRVEIFEEIFWVFLILGTLVGVVVIAYMLYNVYKYRIRDDSGEPGADPERPRLGEIPTGGGGGRKLFVSLALSAVIVISLIAWTYLMLLYVEQGAAAQPNDVPGAEEGAFAVEVVGSQFVWEFTYPNGHTSDELRVPRGQRVTLSVTSADVFHNFGIPGLRAKADAVPGRTTETWFQAEETGEYRAQCYELCGSGHSYMTAKVIVMEPAAFEQWYANTTATNETGQ